ncbi:MAG: RidA family protein [Thermostichales cyanobacterium BF4_bins_65]
MGKELVTVSGFPTIAPYSPAVKVGTTLYISGTLAMDSEGKVIGSDIQTQTRAVLEAMQRLLVAAGGKMDDIVFCQVFLKDFADYPGMNEVYRSYFSGVLPARYVIQAGLVREEFLVEMAAIADLRGS